jgi:hypothetical protein
MHIPAYQIHNALSTYSLQLFKAGTDTQNADPDPHPPVNRISSETKRQAIIDKVAADIVQRITRLDALTAKHLACAPSPVPTSQVDTLDIQNNQFAFNTLDIHNIKTSRTLSVEDSIFLIKRDDP